jgi:hypothetical protein
MPGVCEFRSTRQPGISAGAGVGLIHRGEGVRPPGGFLPGKYEEFTTIPLQRARDR